MIGGVARFAMKVSTEVVQRDIIRPQGDNVKRHFSSVTDGSLQFERVAHDTLGHRSSGERYAPVTDRGTNHRYPVARLTRQATIAWATAQFHASNNVRTDKPSQGESP